MLAIIGFAILAYVLIVIVVSEWKIIGGWLLFMFGSIFILWAIGMVFY